MKFKLTLATAIALTSLALKILELIRDEDLFGRAKRRFRKRHAKPKSDPDQDRFNGWGSDERKDKDRLH